MVQGGLTITEARLVTDVARNHWAFLTPEALADALDWPRHMTQEAWRASAAHCSNLHAKGFRLASVRPGLGRAAAWSEVWTAPVQGPPWNHHWKNHGRGQEGPRFGRGPVAENDVALAITEYRRSRNLTLAEVGEVLGFSRTFVNSLTSGRLVATPETARYILRRLAGKCARKPPRGTRAAEPALPHIPRPQRPEPRTKTMKKRYETENEGGPICDLCVASLATAPAWKSRTEADLVVPSSSWDPDAPGWIPTVFPVSEEWGLCSPCRDLVHSYDAKGERLMLARYIDNRGPGCESPVILAIVARIARTLNVAPKSPWEPCRPVRGLRRMWIQDGP